MNNLEQYHQMTIDEYVENQNETLEDLEQKRKAVYQDINFLADDLQLEFYREKIRELEEQIKALTERVDFKNRQLNYLYHFFDTDILVFLFTAE